MYLCRNRLVQTSALAHAKLQLFLPETAKIPINWEFATCHFGQGSHLLNLQGIITGMSALAVGAAISSKNNL